MKTRNAILAMVVTYATVCAAAVAAYKVLFAINARYGSDLMPFYGAGLYLEIGLLFVGALLIAYFAFAAATAKSRTIQAVIVAIAFVSAVIGVGLSLILISCSFGDCL